MVGVKHSKEELAEMQSYPLELKVALTKDRIRGWYNEYSGNVYCSRSGGKDSDVLGDIISKMYPDVPNVYVDTGLEWKSVQEHGRAIADTILYPKMNFMKVVQRYGYPVISKEVSQKVSEARSKPDGVSAQKFQKDSEVNKRYPQFSMERYAYLLDAPFKISHMCCKVMKKHPAIDYEQETGRKPFVATLAEESRLRKQKWMKVGCNAFEQKRPVSNPLLFWTESDILRYIIENDVQIADIYGDVVSEMDGFQYYPMGFETRLTTTGAKRTGCIWCLFGISQDSDRLLRLKAHEPKRYDFVMSGGEFIDGMWTPNKDGLGYKFVIDWINDHNGKGVIIRY